jgi:formylglycine-generating enzyme required for sulfatase activity
VTQFIEAVQDLRGCADDEELRGGEVACTSLGLPMLWSGNFADVYKIHCPATGNTWALKCFTRAITGRQERYRQVAAQLEAAALPFTVPFVYLERGIQVRGRWFPAIKMQWVQGQTLNRFVEESLDKPSMLRQLLDLWPKLAARLRDARIAHADLQHGNVLLVPTPDGKLALRLIDYDGMWVPSLAGAPSGELGHPAYQHPQRQRQGTYNADLDRFSHLVIYTAVHALAAGLGELWQRFNNDENLLFREGDFQCPERSELFQTLWADIDSDVHALAGHLVLACTGPLESASWLDDIVRGGRVAPLTPGQERDVSELMAAGRAAAGAMPGAVVARPVPPSGATTLLAPGTWLPAAPIVAPPAPVAAPRAATSGATVGLSSRVPSTAEQASTGTQSRRRVSLPLRPIRWFDGLLAAVVGKRNETLHNFLRAVCVIVIVLLVGVTIGSLVPLNQQRTVSKRKPETTSATQPDVMDRGDTGTVKIELSNPTAQVEVIVDRDAVGITDLKQPLRLKVGEHDLLVTARDYQSVSKSFAVRLGQEEVLRVRLEPKAKASVPVPAKPSPIEAADGFRRKRGDPRTYAVERLVATAGFGAISSKQGPPHGYHWVVLTGLVPLAQQTWAYHECFRGAYPRGSENDTPKYVDFQVARAELQAQPSAAPPWAALEVAKAFDLEETWGGRAQELVDKRFVNRSLVYPLAQRVGGEWGAEVAHLPEIPVGDVGTPAAVGEVRHATRHRHGAAAETATSETTAIKSPEADAAKPEGTMYFLFRFMDFTAEPGKRYSYSVKLILKNPNHNVETRYLLDASLAKNEDLETRWSDPSKVVVVPRDDQLLVKELKAPPRVSDQPAAALVLLKFVADQGQQFFAEQAAVNRGQLLNFANHPAQGVMPADAGPLDRAAYTSHRISFDTGMILIDVRGGERQPGREATKEPAEMLFLDVDGSLVARDEIRDAEGVRQVMGLTPQPTPIVRPAKPPGPRPWSLRNAGRATPSPSEAPGKEISVELGNGVKLEMVLIPAGEFLMGSPDSDGYAKSDEKPQHRVRITKPFYLSMYLVTQEQWEAVMGSNPSNFKGPKNPVERVGWGDCQQFIDKMNETLGVPGGKFQLPTEAQWEYACRAGSTTRFCFGDDEGQLGEYAWYDKNSGRQTHPVGEKRPNAWGLYDMHGNVDQWCADWYYGLFANSTVDDPTGPRSGSYRVYRGGGWYNPAGYCRSANRYFYAPGGRGSDLGLRVSRVPAE